MLSASNLALRFGATVALVNASATVAPGEVLAITGPSGSGKTTFLYCLSGLLEPDDGTVEFEGRTLKRLTDTDRSNLRRKRFGFVFQFAELVPELNLRENIGLPLELNRVGRSERRLRTGELIERFGLGECAGRRPAQVSGGQAQRAAVARAMAHRPAVVFADEPTGALDGDNGAVVLEALLETARHEGTAVVLVTHTETVAAKADRAVQVRDGRTER